MSLRTRLLLIHALAVVVAISAFAALVSLRPAWGLARLGLAAGGLALLVTLPLLIAALARPARRIGALTDSVRRGSAGVADDADDEIGRLGRALDQASREGRARHEALERERDERERILAHMSDGVVLLDRGDRVLRMNVSFAELVGASIPADPGTPFLSYVRVAELEEMIQAARDGRRTVEKDVRLWMSAQRFVHATATPLGGASSDAVLLVLHDLSAAERLNRMRQEFVANVSHELRTPLTSLRGYAETLLDGGLEDAANREQFVRVIRDQAVRLESLTEDLLALAELERPGARPRLEPLDLREVAERQAAALRPQATRAGVDIRLTPGGAAAFLGDRVRIEQVVANLLDNAIKYSERGPIDVRVGAEDGVVWCEVQDHGGGIPAEDVPRIFERFYRVDKGRSRAMGGTGLGLAIVKHILGLHGGEVAVQSRLGEGSTFRFVLPTRPPSSS